MKEYHLQIVTVDGMFFDGQAEYVWVRSINGDVGILANHIDYVTALGMGEARVTVGGKVRRAACAGGLLAVTDGQVRLVATTFEWAEDIDRQRALRAKEKAEERIRNARDDRELRLAESKLRRALARIKVTE